MSLVEKLKTLKTIRQAIKKKRLVFDEAKENFGMDEMYQLIKVKNTSEVKGYPFRVSKDTSITKGTKLALKIVPIETKYEKHEHPCYLESMFLKELTDTIVDTGISPHITYYLGAMRVSNKCRALKQLNLKRLEVEEKIRTHSVLLASEFVPGGSLDSWVFDTYENDKKISDTQWKVLVFQLLYTIAVMQHHYKLMHNDFHYGNILIDNSITPGGYYVYEIDGKTYYLKNEGMIPKIWDFEFSMSFNSKMEKNYHNKFITGPYIFDRTLQRTVIDIEEAKKKLSPQANNVPYNFNKVYDVHYFLTSLLDLYISRELFDWIINLYPEELIPEEETSSSTHENNTLTETHTTNTVSSVSTLKSHDDITTTTTTTTYSDTHTHTSVTEHTTYLCNGRLVNGVDSMFTLPTAPTLLQSTFFSEFSKVPADFDPTTAVYFRAGF